MTVVPVNVDYRTNDDSGFSILFPCVSPFGVHKLKDIDIAKDVSSCK